MSRTPYGALALLFVAAVAAPAHAADPSDALDRLVRRFNRCVEAGNVERAERVAARAAHRFPEASAVELMSRHLDTIQSDLAAYTDQSQPGRAEVPLAALREVSQEVWTPKQSTEATEDISTADLLKLISESNEAARLLAMRELASKRRDGFHPETQVAAVREVWEELMRQERFAEASEVVTFGMPAESQVFMHADLIRMYLKAQYKLKPEPSNPSAAAELAEIVAEYNELFQQRRYAEAEVLAKQAKELDPESPLAETMLWKAKFARRSACNEEIRREKEGSTCEMLPKSWDELTRMRRNQAEASCPDCPVKERKEREIEQQLRKSISLDFEEAPLSKVLTHVAVLTGIDIVIDDRGLEEEGVTDATPVSICVEDVQVRSALNLMLQPRHLGWTVEDEVLKITSKRRLQGRLEVRTYPVADLVVPIPQAPQAAVHEDMPGPQAPPAARDGKAAACNACRNTCTQTIHTAAADQPEALADFDSLAELITTTVQPESWVENGGDATVRAYETTLSLVVRQTERGHEEIRDLLEQLRRMQDLQVTMEFCFITVPENFFERVGVDFDFNGQPSPAYLENDIKYFVQPIEHVELPGGVTTENGRAVLTPEEARRLLQCAQQDPVSNIMFAPKVTAFNGQRVELASVTKPNPHTTAVDFALAARPVISGDRRVISGVIECEAGAATGEAKTIDFRLQDGQTLLVDCGEIERPAGCQATGTPILSKVPYVSRLFKNTGVSRSQRRLLMVTPRIIVQEEEEELLGLPVH